ncbi:MAG: 3-phosphoglycerate dehydrogenase [Acidobacteria bacterium]|nr:3-phosphoglycerate dehydrogenase [Acidobacteriota bacterium]
MLLVSIPDDAPAVLAASAAFETLRASAEFAYHDTLPGDEDTLIARIGAAAAVLNIRSSTRFTDRVFAGCPGLRLLSIWGTGTDHVDLAAAARHHVAVANTPGVSAPSIAEHALALAFAVARRIPEMDAATRAGGWPRGRFIQLAGRTCGIIGYGAIGSAFAGLARGIGMRVLVWTPHPERHPGVAFVPLDRLYAEADIVSLHLRVSPETRHFLDAAALARLKPTAILINTARGTLIDEDALTNALRAGRLAGAGLDVFTTEPLPARAAILEAPNVVVSPHCAGITPEALAAGLAMAVENIRAFFDGRPEHLVEA